MREKECVYVRGRERERVCVFVYERGRRERDSVTKRLVIDCTWKNQSYYF